MALARIGPRFVTDGEAAMDVAPMVRRNVARFHAERFHRIDRLEHALHLRPTNAVQQDFTAGGDEGKRLIGFPRGDGAHDIDARDDSSEVVGRTSARTRRRCQASKAEGAAAAVEDLSLRRRSPKRIQFSILLRPVEFRTGEAVD